MQRTRILFLAANPAITTRQALDEEVREIGAKLRSAEYRDAFELVPQWAARPDDLLQALNQYRPNIIHFSGIGSDVEGLILASGSGRNRSVSDRALTRLFRMFAGGLRVVVLNACYSQPQAEAIAEHVDCVLGTHQGISTQAAVRFSASFYRALAFGWSVENAFEQGRLSLELEGIGEANTPDLILRPLGVVTDRVVLLHAKVAADSREPNPLEPRPQTARHGDPLRIPQNSEPALHNRETAFNDLLTHIFDGHAAGLRIWVRQSLGKAIHDELPGDCVNLHQLAFETVLVIQRHGRVDATLFSSLTRLRPRLADLIWGVARSYGIVGQMPARPDCSPCPRAANSALAMALPDGGADRPQVHPQTRKLEDALRRKQNLAAAGLPTDSILAEIRNIKRDLRRGGQLHPGDVLGDRYLLAKQIGRGGFATVWEARDNLAGDDVAIKVLHPESAGDMIRRQRFFRGARIMAELTHPVVVRIREREAEDDGFFYFVMDLVPGGNLHDAVIAGRVQSEQAVSLILHVGEALAKAHARGHVHRDVKPHNVLLTASGEPRLTDFDLVTAQDTTGGTRTGALGTFIYAPLEMMERPQEADARTDVYGLGMTLAFMVYGAKLTQNILITRERFIEDLRCTPAVKAVLKQATSEDMERRYSDAAAFCAALQTATTASKPLYEEVIRHPVQMVPFRPPGIAVPRIKQISRQWHILRLLENSKTGLCAREISAAIGGDISERTIFRDLWHLQEAGFPLSADQGRWCILGHGEGPASSS